MKKILIVVLFVLAGNLFAQSASGINPTLRQIIFKGLIPDDHKVYGVNVGAAVSDSGLVAVEYGDRFNHVTEITIPSGAFTQSVDSNTALGWGRKIYDFPEGAIKVTRVHYDLAVGASSSDTAWADVGAGSVVASGGVAVLGGTATFEDFVDGFAATTTNIEGGKEAEAGQVDGTATAKDFYLNFADTWADDGDLTFTGKITIHWTWVGDD